MKLFWKIFAAVFISFAIVVSFIFYVVSTNQISNAESHILEENRIVGALISKEIEVGYLEFKWPFEGLKKISERDDFLFWWIVRDDGIIHLADNASFMGTYTRDYFPQIADIKVDENVFLDYNKNYGIFVKTLEMGKDKWSFCLGFSLKTVSEMRRDIILSSIIISLLALLILGVMLYFTVAYFTKPITKLRDITSDVAKGDLDIEIQVKTKDEIGELASSLKQMIKNLKQSRDIIEKHTKELEQKVQERTKDLDKKVKELTDTKTALLNMMEDMNEANKGLIKTREDLKGTLSKLKEMDVKKNEFISIAAHELKTPLTSIHGFSQLLQNKSVLEDHKKRENYLKIMEDETKRLAKLVNDILDFSRIDLGAMKFSFEEADVNEIMEAVESEMDMLIKEKGLESEYDIEKDLPKIVTDRERVIEIMINLINNSVKYTPKGKITVKIFREKESVHFMVKDTGIGIAKEYHDKIFGRFYQVDSSCTRKAGGVGLGLALCKEFLNLMGGKIWFKSEFGKGSEFHFTLPISFKKVCKR